MKNLSAFVNEDELDGIVSSLGDRENLCRDPGMILILEPDSGSFAVYVFRHACRKNERLSSKKSSESCRCCLVAPSSNNLSLLYFPIP